MTFHFNYACFVVVPVALQMMLGSGAALAASSRKCGTIYRGFAQCLMVLGDKMSISMQREETLQEIDTICRSWDEFHLCANAVLAECPEGAAAVWDSLRQESKKMQFSGNLYDMCANLAQPIATEKSPASPEETNQELLKGHAQTPGHALTLHLPACLSLLAVLVVM